VLVRGQLSSQVSSYTHDEGDSCSFLIGAQARTNKRVCMNLAPLSPSLLSLKIQKKK
jgi:hypothetical protein